MRGGGSGFRVAFPQALAGGSPAGFFEKGGRPGGEGRVLVLEHRFRTGSGWGIPGGFLEKGEQPEEALRRELREEIGLELESAEIAFVRTLKQPRQIEIIFRCHPRGKLGDNNAEIKRADWFELDKLPPGLSKDQRRLIERALKVGAKAPD